MFVKNITLSPKENNLQKYYEKCLKISDVSALPCQL